jgi:uncharacterized damage-inducible protein DinB
MRTINIDKSIKKYNSFNNFVESLKNLNDKTWTAPITENKWSIKEIIGHIMAWDKYMLEEAILKIKTNQPVTIENLNIDEFNKNAVESIKAKEKDEIIRQTLHFRTEIIKNLALIAEEKFFNNFIDSSGNYFSLHNYLEEYIQHDEHHKQQIEEFLKSIH